MTKAAALYRLQELDRRWQAATEKLAALPQPREIEALTAELGRIEAQTADRKEKLAQAERQRRQAEAETAACIVRRREMEERLYSGSINSVKEMAKMEKMIEECRRDAARAEEKELALLVRAEELAGEMTELAGTAAALEAERRGLESAYATAAGELRAAMADLPARREAAAAALDAGTLSQYEGLRQKKGGIAVVPVVGEACGGCRLGIAVSVLQELRTAGDKLIRCDNCGRILYWRGE